VSRGLGILQRRVCEVLYAAEGHELPLRELRRQLGEPDRSNLRCGIRGLLKRGLVEELRSEEERRVKLSFSGIIFANPLPEIPRRSRVSLRTKLREERRALREARAEERRRLEAEAGKGPRWIGYEHRFVRRRFPGPTQTRILSVLWEYADPVDEGLPVTAVKAIVGGNRSNTRRAIRTLLLRGQLDESEDGERIRLSDSAAFWYSLLFPPIPQDPIDDAHAKKILRAYQDAGSPKQT
jgi:hypothetical protein